MAILGEGSTLEAPTARDFWQKVRERATIRANVGINGKEYAKYGTGTNFGNRIIVIDKVPAKSGVPQSPITGDFDTLEEVWKRLHPSPETELLYHELLAAYKSDAFQVWDMVQREVAAALELGPQLEECENLVGSLGPQYEEDSDLILKLLAVAKPELALKALLEVNPTFSLKCPRSKRSSQ